MSLNMSIRVIIKVFLTIQLLLLIFRQMIDFAGIQWLMIIINAVAIIITITAFFGHLVLYVSFQVFLILYNIFVICIYAKIITTSDTSVMNDDFIDSTQHIHSLNSAQNFYHSDLGGTRTTPLLPSIQLLSFDPNSRSFWYVIVSNHVSELHATIASSSGIISNSVNVASRVDRNDMGGSGLAHQPSLVDESLVDLCVQYIEIAIASLHIFFSLLGIGLILLKFKLQRDKLSRNNDKTTPPLPPYTISPQMNHYMSYTGVTGHSSGKIYNSASQNGSLRRSKRRRSTRSLHHGKSKANSMGNLNLRTSTGSLRSTAKQTHRKSATSLLNDTSFNNNTIGSRNSGSHGGTLRGNKAANNNNSIYNQHNSSHNETDNCSVTYQTLMPNNSNNHYSSNHNNNHHYNQHHSMMAPGARSSAASSYLMGSSSQHHAAKFMNSDSETDYYHTFTPSYVNNGLINPLYGNRNSYLNDSETAI